MGEDGQGMSADAHVRDYRFLVLFAQFTFLVADEIDNFLKVKHDGQSCKRSTTTLALTYECSC